MPQGSDYNPFTLTPQGSQKMRPPDALDPRPEELPTPPIPFEQTHGIWAPMRRELERSGQEFGGMVQGVKNNPLSLDSFKTYLNILGAARVLGGGSTGIPGTDPIYRGSTAVASEPGLTSTIVRSEAPYAKQGPVSGRDYINAFRTSVANKDEAGAINTIHNADRQNVSMPFMPPDLFGNENLTPNISHAQHEHMMRRLGGSFNRQIPTVFN